MKWVLLICLVLSGCAVARVTTLVPDENRPGHMRKEKAVKAWCLGCTSIETDDIKTKHLGDFPDSIISIGALGSK